MGVGGDESDEFKRHNRLLIERWSATCAMQDIPLPGTNHFTVIEDVIRGRKSAASRGVGDDGRYKGVDIQIRSGAFNHHGSTVLRRRYSCSNFGWHRQRWLSRRIRRHGRAADVAGDFADHGGGNHVADFMLNGSSSDCGPIAAFGIARA